MGCVDRNIIFVEDDAVFGVAPRMGCVDRNNINFASCRIAPVVAPRMGCVDRNHF